MRKSKGFTLIELVVVIAILGILAGIAIPRFMDAQATARGSKIVADMRTLESALTMYMINNTITVNNGDENDGKYDVSILKNANYIATVPKVPSGNAIFPNGLELDDINTTKCFYQIHYHKFTGETAIYLIYNGLSLNLNILTK